MGLQEKVNALDQRLEAVEQGLETLARYHAENHEVILQAFEHNDMHILVLRMMLQDVQDCCAIKDPPHQDHVDRLHQLRKEGASLEELEEEYLSPMWWRMMERGQRLDLEWYYDRYALLMSAIRLFGFIAFAVKGEEDGTGS